MTSPVTRSRPPLDERVAELAGQHGRSWGVPDAVLGILAVPAALLLSVLVIAAVPRLPGAVATALGTTVLAALGVAAALRAARQSGGFRRALGLDLPGWRDLGPVVGWTLLLLLVQVLALTVVTAAVPALQGSQVDNVGFLRDEPLPAVVAVAVLAVGVAPVLEELLFRGLVLRGLMMRLGFWPSALVSSTFFGLFHAQTAGLESVSLVVATGVFGLGLCVLVRRSGRLGPAIGVHALRNAVGIAAVLLT